MEKKPYKIERAALSFTRWIGSPVSIVVHTVIFIACFIAVALQLIAWNEMLLVLTTIVSLEAIYLSLFIQMTVNYQGSQIEEVGEDIDEIQEDVGEIQEDIDEIQEDVDELQEDVEDISEDVEEITEEEDTEEKAEEARKAEQRKTLTDIQTDLRKLMNDISKLQKNGQTAPHTPPTQQ